MTWRDNLQQASFRGYPFKVLSHDYSVGRRNVLHQYPYKDFPYAEDLGLEADEFKIEGYIIAGPASAIEFDYFQERDNLIAALKTAGPGKLIHPFLGEKLVVTIGRQSIRESFDRGGWARFSMTFALAGESQFPSEEIDPVGAVDDAAEDVINNSSDNFYEQYTQEGQPGWVVQQAYNDFDEFVTSMKSAVSRIRATSGSSLEQIKDTFDDARSTMLEAAAYPCQVAGLVNDVFESVLGLTNLVGDGYLGEVLGHCSGQVYFNKLDSSGEEVSKQMGLSMTDSLVAVAGNSDETGYGVSADVSESTIGGSLVDIAVTTETRARQAANRLAMVNLIRAQAITAAMRTGIRVEYESIAQAEIMQAKLVESLDYHLLKLGDESSSDPYSDFDIYTDNRNLYGSLENLRAVFVKAMSEKGLALGVELTFNQDTINGINSIKLAYDRYKDIDRESDIYDRNKPTIKHPAFMVGELKVLSE